MIIGPSAPELLQGVAAFLGAKELRQTLPPELAFRALVAASLCGQVAAELQVGQALDAAQLQRLQALTTGHSVADMERAVVQGVAAKPAAATPGSAEWQHAKASLAQLLAMANPRFDQRPDVP